MRERERKREWLNKFFQFSLACLDLVILKKKCLFGIVSWGFLDSGGSFSNLKKIVEKIKSTHKNSSLYFAKKILSLGVFQWGGRQLQTNNNFILSSSNCSCLFFLQAIYLLVSDIFMPTGNFLISTHSEKVSNYYSISYYCIII